MDGIRPSGMDAGAALEPAGRGSARGLDKALEEFESLFINQLLKTMRQTVGKGDLFHGGAGEEIYTSLFDTELSRKMAEGGGIGLKNILLRQLGASDKGDDITAVNRWDKTKTLNNK